MDDIKATIRVPEFIYQHPGKGFKDEHVKGLVIQLIQLDEKYQGWHQAIEVCAGGKLYHVVVEHDTDAAALLERGGLRKKVTIIPLDKIQSYKLSRDVLLRLDTVALVLMQRGRPL